MNEFVLCENECSKYVLSSLHALSQSIAVIFGTYSGYLWHFQLCFSAGKGWKGLTHPECQHTQQVADIISQIISELGASIKATEYSHIWARHSLFSGTHQRKERSLTICQRWKFRWYLGPVSHILHLEHVSTCFSPPPPFQYWGDSPPPLLLLLLCGQLKESQTAKTPEAAKSAYECSWE